MLPGNTEPRSESTELLQTETVVYELPPARTTVFITASGERGYPEDA